VTRLGDRLAHPGGALAVIRLAAVPVFVAAERLVDHPVANSAPFGPLIVLAGIYAVLALAGELRGTPLAPARVLACVDLVLITALVATSGGPFSQLRYAFFLLPIGASLLLRPALTAVASAACVALYGGVALTYPDPASVRPDAAGFELTQVLFLGWMGTAATLLAVVLTRRAREIASLATSRGRLVAQALDAEDRARRRLAEALHDEALQNLLAARQLLDAGDASSTALAREGLDEGVAQIRRAVFDLHPYLLEQAGLRAALQAVAERAGRRAGFRAVVDVDPAAEGRRDQLLFSVARELIANAARHSGAAEVQVRVSVTADGLELTVADDGRGIDLEAVGAAQAEGHIGLASCAERAEAVGGELQLAPGAAGRGTVARLRVPAAAPELPAPVDGPPIGVAAASPAPPAGGSPRRAAPHTMVP
jgi:two-component system NarL family sensor kinase